MVAKNDARVNVGSKRRARNCLGRNDARKCMGRNDARVNVWAQNDARVNVHGRYFGFSKIFLGGIPGTPCIAEMSPFRQLIADGDWRFYG